MEHNSDQSLETGPKSNDPQANGPSLEEQNLIKESKKLKKYYSDSSFPPSSLDVIVFKIVSLLVLMMVVVELSCTAYKITKSKVPKGVSHSKHCVNVIRIVEILKLFPIIVSIVFFSYLAKVAFRKPHSNVLDLMKSKHFFLALLVLDFIVFGITQGS